MTVFTRSPDRVGHRISTYQMPDSSLAVGAARLGAVPPYVLASGLMQH